MNFGAPQDSSESAQKKKACIHIQIHAQNFREPRKVSACPETWRDSLKSVLELVQVAVKFYLTAI